MPGRLPAGAGHRPDKGAGPPGKQIHTSSLSHFSSNRQLTQLYESDRRKRICETCFFLQVVVSNLGEAAYEAELGIAFPPSLSYVGLGPGSDINAPSLVNR